MEEIKVDPYRGLSEIRFTIIDGERWFLVVDLVRALRYSEQVIGSMVDRSRVKLVTYNNTKAYIISQRGLLELVTYSRRVEVNRLHDWFFDELLPSHLDTIPDLLS